MCNELHPDSKPISPCGKGYKIFEVPEHDWIHNTISIDRLTGLVHRSFDFPRDGWKEIDHSLPFNISHFDGFCFYLSKKEAIKSLKLWIKGASADSHFVILQIEYRNGKGAHMEKGMFGPGRPVKIALCGSYKPLTDVIIAKSKGISDF